MRRYYRRMNGINGIIVLLYLLIVAEILLFLALWGRAPSPLPFALASLAVLAALCAAVPALMGWAGRRCVRPVEPAPGGSLKWFLIFFAIPFAVFLVLYLAFFPGRINGDSANQYQQVMSGNYSDWHPVLQTLFAFALPMKLTGRGASIVLFQVVEYSLAIAYAGHVIRRRVNLRCALVSVLFIALFPYTLYCVIRPWKDVSFAMGALLLSAYALEIHLSGGAWIENRWHALLFAAVLTATTIFRHNAILFTLPLMIGAILYASRRGKLRVVALFLILFILVKVPLYSALNVEGPGYRQTEKLGVPMTVIGAVVQAHPESLDEESRAFAYSYATQEEWETLYEIGNFNTIKYDINDSGPIERAGTLKVLRIAWKCFRAQPATALRALFLLTMLVYSPTTWTGEISLLLLLFLAAKLRLNDARDWRRLLLAGSVLIYNFGTMLLLMGNTYRFFYYGVPVLPVMLILLLLPERPGGECAPNAASTPAAREAPCA